MEQDATIRSSCLSVFPIEDETTVTTPSPNTAITTTTSSTSCNNKESTNDKNEPSTSSASLHPQRETIQEELETLLQGIELVSKLAAMDSSEYLNKTEHTSCKVLGTKEDIQSRLDELQAKWTLEDTSLPSLVASIHRLQSNIGHLHQESTTFTSQMNEMHLSLSKFKSQNEKYKKVLKKLYVMNQKLVEKLRQKKKKSRQFIKTVQEFVSQKKQEELNTEEFLVACHESMMKSKIKQHPIKVFSKQQNGVNRSRTNTAESTFSDLDAYSYFGDYSIFQPPPQGEEDDDGDDDDDKGEGQGMEHLQDDLSFNFVPRSHCRMRSVDVGTLEMPLGQDGNGVDVSFNSLESSSSSSLSSSSRSLFVTDDNVATLSFSDAIHNDDAGTATASNSRTELNTLDKMNSKMSNPLLLCRSKSNLQTYTISFPSSREIGLQFVQVPLSSSPRDSMLTLRRQKKDNRTRCFSDGATLDLAVVNEHEERLESKSLFSTLTHRHGTTGIRNKKELSSDGLFTHSKSFPSHHHHNTNKSSSFTIVENMFSGFHSKSHKLKDDNDNLKHRSDHHSTTCCSSKAAILVADFQGFNTSLHIRPTVGARLIAINDQSLLEGQWTVEKVTATLKDIKAQNHEANNDDCDIVLTFRNDPISGKLPKKTLEEHKKPSEITVVPEKEDIVNTDHKQDSCKTSIDESSSHVSIRDGTELEDSTNPSKDGKDKKSSLSFFNLDSFTPRKDHDNLMSFFGITITKQSDNKSK